MVRSISNWPALHQDTTLAFHHVALNLSSLYEGVETAFNFLKDFKITPKKKSQELLLKCLLAYQISVVNCGVFELAFISFVPSHFPFHFVVIPCKI